MKVLTHKCNFLTNLLVLYVIFDPVLGQNEGGGTVYEVFPMLLLRHKLTLLLNNVAQFFISTFQ